jgi:uncharacterized protein involved in tellurium resistance
MDYTYLLEEMANKNLTFNEISNENGVCVLNIICYHIETKHKYPFLQFMMDKVPYCNNIVKEQITFPYIFLRNDSSDIEEIVLGRVKSGLELLGCDYDKVTEDMFKGILFGKDCGNPYALVNITGIDINGLNFMRQTTCWFVLPSEIINTKKVCNIDIDSAVTYLFIDIPYLGLLFNSKTNEPYMMPDAVYTGSEIKNAEFQSIFGNTKKKVYDSCGEYYFFYRSFSDAVKDGGWLNVRNPNKIGNRIIVDDNSNKYITGCINRYALFVEGKIYMEAGREFGITDDIIESLYPEPCIIICYSGEHEIKPDILVKNYESFVSLSYHRLDKKLLNESFTEEKKKEYMIA